MKSAELNKSGVLSYEENELFFQQLETNNAFFKEALEAMLTLVISDPLLTLQVADLIESDYRNLFLIIAKKQHQDDKNDISGCCSIN